MFTLRAEVKKPPRRAEQPTDGVLILGCARDAHGRGRKEGRRQAHKNIGQGGLDILGYSGILWDISYIRYMTTSRLSHASEIAKRRPEGSLLRIASCCCRAHSPEYGWLRTA